MVLPVFNSATTLSAAIDDCLRQTVVDFELLIVCNGCTDGSLAIAHDAAARDGRVRVVELPRANVIEAANTGINLARAPWVARMDADDRMAPERLAASLACAEATSHVDVVSTQVVYEGTRYRAGEGGQRGHGMSRYVDWVNGLSTHELKALYRFVDAPVINPSTMVRRALLGERAYRDGAFAEDHDLWLRLFAAGARFAQVPRPLVTWVDSSARLTRVDTRYGTDARRALVHRCLLAGPLTGGRRCQIWGAGPYGKRHARGLLALGGNVTRFIDIDPKKIGQVSTGGLAVIAPDTLGPPDGALTVIAVASRGAGATVSRALEDLGHRPHQDFVFVQ